MLNTLWKKTLRDIWENKGRSTFVVLSIAVGTFTLGVILNTYVILTREMTANYAKANPAAISFQIERFDSELLGIIGQHPKVDKVDARRTIKGEIKTLSGEWKPLWFYVLSNYQNTQLDIVELDQGMWPQQPEQMVIERQALSVLDGKLKDQVFIRTPGRPVQFFQISGVAHDVSLAQAEWENVVYSFTNFNGIERLGLEKYFNLLKLSLNDENLDREQMQPIANELKELIQKKGYRVKNITLSEPGDYPHANITDGMFMIQKVFAVLCCLLAAILAFNLIASMLATQLPIIGTMKAIGASSSQIRLSYYRGIILLGLLGLLLSLPSAYFGSKIYVNALSSMMNIDIQSYSIPIWIFVVQIALGVFIPLFASMIPIVKASQRTIHETFIEFGHRVIDFGNSPIERVILKLSFFSQPVKLAIRNLARHKARFLLTATILCVASALFMATFHINQSMKQAVIKDRLSKKWDINITLDQYLPRDQVNQTLGQLAPLKIEGVTRVGVYLETTKFHLHKTEIETQITLTRLSSNSQMLNPTLLEGHWLTGKPGELVINQKAREIISGFKIGMSIPVKIFGQSYPFRIVGVVKNVGGPMIYTGDFPADMYNPIGEKVNGFFLQLSGNDRTSLARLKGPIFNLLKNNQIIVSRITTVWEGLRVVEDHFEIIYSLMMLLTLIVIFISSNGIILMTTTNIIERTREIGVLKAIGASNKELVKMFFSESLMIAIIGWSFGCLLTLPISYLVTHWLGVLLIQTPFELVLNTMIFIYTLPLIIIISILSSILPMKKVTRMSVAKSIIYE